MPKAAYKPDPIETLTSESLMRWNWSAMETPEHAGLMRRMCPHFGEAFKGVSDIEALQFVRDFLRSTKAKRYLERKAVWESYWSRGAARRAAIASNAA